MGTRQKISPYGYKLLFIGNSLQLLPEASTFQDTPNSSLDVPVNPDTDIYWTSLLNVYGAYRPGISQVWLDNPYMEDEIVGTIVVDPLDDRYLIFSVDPDTLPQNTLDPVDSVINPVLNGPNAGLPGPIANKRYLIVDQVGDDSVAWGTILSTTTPQAVETMIIGQKYMIASVGTTNFVQLGAISSTIGTEFIYNTVQPSGTGTVLPIVIGQANDILQFDSVLDKWYIAFDSSKSTTTQYVLNITTQVQYRFASTPANSDHPEEPAQWMKSYEGYYGEGDYSIVI
tara:strand:- start:372 stop:1226 length:855 start_codon:yes stop_codon:yes gene_type:complete